MITTSIVLRINMVSSCLVKLFISEALLLLPKYMCTRTCMHIIYIYVYYFKCVYIYIYICTHIKPYKAVCLCAYMCVGVILTQCDDHIIIPSLHSIGRNTGQTQRIVLPVVLAV